MEAAKLVHKAIDNGITAFDTSPYYGPSEEILGKALQQPEPGMNEPFHRKSYQLITKVGRISGDVFDYSPEWVRKSVERSLKRLNTDHLDLVYCHDVEFVSPEETLAAVKELRTIRDEPGQKEKKIRYIGICGYPVDYLCDMAEMILKETGEPLDAVQSYANYTLQNTRLATRGVERLKKAGVEIVTNGSVLGMGLLRSNGLPVGGMGDWHPAPSGLRDGCKKASNMLQSRGENSERLEVVAMRWALDSWLDVGAAVGTRSSELARPKCGVSVIGVSSDRELDDAIQVWRNIEGKRRSEDKRIWKDEQESLHRMAKEIRDVLGEYYDYAWASPEEGWVRKEHKEE